MVGGVETQRGMRESMSSPVVVVGKREYALGRDDKRRVRVCDDELHGKGLEHVCADDEQGRDRGESSKQDVLAACKEEDDLAQDDAHSSNYSVHVRIERSVEVHYDKTYDDRDTDDHRRPRTFWGSLR